MPAAIGTFLLWVVGESAVASTVVVSTVTVAEVVGTVALTAGSIALQSALRPSVPSPEAGKEAVKQSIPPCIRAVGEVRVAGSFMLDEAVDNVLFRVFACHQGRIDSFRRWYLHDDRVELDGDGNVIPLKDGSYALDKAWTWNNPTTPSKAPVKIETRLGLATETAYASLVSELSLWTSNHRGDGIASYYIRCQNAKLDKVPRQFPNGKPAPSPVFRAQLQYDWRDEAQSRSDASTWTWNRNPVVCLVNELWRFRGYDWDTKFAPTLDILTASANVCDELVDVKNGVAEFMSAANAGDAAIDLSDVNGIGPGIVLNLSPNQDDAETKTVDHVSGNTVTLTAPLTNAHALYEHVTWVAASGAPAKAPRYTCNGWFTEDNTLDQVIALFLECMDGWMCRNGQGAVVIKAGKYEAPVVTLTAEDVVDYTWSSFVEGERAVNELRPSFCSPAFDFTAVETDGWRDEGDIAARGGEVKSQPFYPKFVDNNSQCRRLTKRKVARLIAGAGQLRTKDSGIVALGERYIRVTLGELEIEELADAVLEVTGDPELSDDGMHFTFPVTAADVNIDAWNAFTEEGNGPSTQDRLPQEELTAPTLDSVTPFFETNGSANTQGVRLTIDATGPNRSDLTWAVRWRPTGAASWVEAQFSDIDDAPSVEFDTDFVQTDAMLEVEVAYLTGAGSISPWSDTATVDTSTDDIAPAAPAGVGQSVSGSDVTITWRNPTSANFVAARVWRATSGAGFGTASDMSGAQPGPLGGTDSFVDAGVATGTYDYWVTAENSAGTRSTEAGPVTATV